MTTGGSYRLTDTAIFRELVALRALTFIIPFVIHTIRPNSTVIGRIIGTLINICCNDIVIFFVARMLVVF